MYMLVDCSNCRTPLQLPPGAKSIRCTICRAITLIADPRSIIQPLSHSSSSGHPPRPTPSPYNHAPPRPTPQSQGSKRAVICGVPYKNTQNELKGCINDAKCVKYLLINKFNFPESSIVMLTVMLMSLAAALIVGLLGCAFQEVDFYQTSFRHLELY